MKPFHKVGVISRKVAPQKATRKKIQYDSDSDFSLDNFDHDDTFSFSDDEYVDDSLEILKKNSSTNNNAYFAEKEPCCAVEKNSQMSCHQPRILKYHRITVMLLKFLSPQIEYYQMWWIY